MINKIQKYLLLHYPAVWNIRLVPMLLILLATHLIFFGIGYLATSTKFDQSYYYHSPWGNFGLLYFVCILISVLLLIGWLVFYSRNNGFRTFYPRKTSQLFLEWIMILVITVGISFVPFSLSEGYMAKWRSAASFKDAQEAMEILDKAKVLIPQSTNSYDYKTDYNEPIPVPEGMTINAESVNLDNFSIQYSGSGNIIIRGYTGPSLLFYSNYHYYDYYYYNTREYKDQMYVDSTQWEKVRRPETVKKWLQAGDKANILALMKEFEQLQRKHDMPVNITPDNWLKRIYQPPFFPVNNSTMIRNYQPTTYEGRYNSYDLNVGEEVAEPEVIGIHVIDDTINYTLPAEADRGYVPAESLPYLQYEELAAGYEQIMNCYTHNKDTEWFTLFCMCMAVIAAVFVFSFRVTSGKSWLIAFVSSGVLIFIVILLAVGLGQSLDWRHEEIIIMFVAIFWIVLFFVILSKIIIKINNKSHKGRSNIYLNIMLWLLPCIIPLSFLTVVAHSHFSDLDYFDCQEKDVICMFWINIPIVILSMWGICSLIRGWKSIAEE